MATQAKVHEVLGNANAVESVLERQADQVESVAARGARNVAAHTTGMLAIRSAFPGLHWVRWMPVAAGDGHGPTVLSAQGLKALHEVREHAIQTGVLAVELNLGEVGIVRPIHFATQ
jgi:hypothetical protein